MFLDTPNVAVYLHHTLTINMRLQDHTIAIAEHIGPKFFVTLSLRAFN